jgi:hypothetical protein
MSAPEIKTPIASVELQEYLFAQTAAKYAARTARGACGQDDMDRITGHIRGAFRLNRFTLFNWLMQNGVSIPAELLDDRTHPEVGNQTPDQPVTK